MNPIRAVIRFKGINGKVERLFVVKMGGLTDENLH
jgi:hypothetical protein